MRKVSVTVATLLIASIMPFISNASGILYEDANVEITTGQSLTLSLESLNQGMIIEYNWYTDDQYDNVDFKISDGTNDYHVLDDVSSANDQFIIPSNGDYTIYWVNDNWIDTVTLWYTVEILNPPALDDYTLQVFKSFSENPCHQGNSSIATIVVKNINDDQIKVKSIGIHFDFFPTDIYVMEDNIDEILATNQEFSADLEFDVNTDVTLGIHIYDIYITYEARVLGNWYDTDWQSADQTDFEVIEIDRDFDGYPDSQDTFPDNPGEWKDTDSDGVGDNTDKFPSDPAASVDSDGDGYPNNWNLGKSELDSTSGLYLDAFPDDPAASVDTDGDGSPDDWNTGKTESDSTTGLTLDAFPSDPAASKDTDGDGFPTLFHQIQPLVKIQTEMDSRMIGIPEKLNPTQQLV